MTAPSPGSTEVIAVASGKGGTGKTLITACLGYALTSAGHRVLMIDTDIATDGLSLILLGPKGMKNIFEVDSGSTFKGILDSFTQSSELSFAPVRIDRSGPGDHGVIYQAIISGRRIYGEVDDSRLEQIGPADNRSTFRACVSRVFDRLRASNEFDYIIVDTRGGFAFDTTDICALADSFIVVTDPDYTSFYQDRNLVKRVGLAAAEMARTSVLRAIIVNRSTEGDEKSFRLELAKEFPVTFDETYAIPLDIEAIKAYKTQDIPYLVAPASRFSYATLAAFAEILNKVTAQWETPRVERWNALVAKVSSAIEVRNAEVKRIERDQEERAERLKTLETQNTRLREEIEQLKREMSRIEDRHKDEVARSTALVSTVLGEIKNDRNERRGVVHESNETVPPSRSFFERLQKGPLWKRMLILYAAVGAVAVIVTFAFGEFRRSTGTDQLERLYRTDAPPALRIQNLTASYASGRDTFDLIDLSNMDLHGAYLRGASFRTAKLNHTDLRESNLQRCNLSSASLQGAQLDGARLGNANLAATNLSDASMRQAELAGANLQGANLSNTDLMTASLDGVDLRGATMTGALVEVSQLKNARIDGETTAPLDLRAIRQLSPYSRLRRDFVDDIVKAIETNRYEDALSILDRALQQSSDDPRGGSELLSRWRDILSKWVAKGIREGVTSEDIERLKEHQVAGSH